MGTGQGRLTVVIPCWSGTDQLTEMTLALCRQVKPMCDELIVSEDGTPQPELEEIANKYLLHPRVGHVDNLKIGLAAASNEFVAVLDSDIVISTGTLRDLCLPDSIVCPYHYGAANGFTGWFFVGPKALIQKTLPDVTDREAIVGWGREFSSRVRTLVSDKMVYLHLYDQSYSRYQKTLLEQERAEPRKEIDPQRHKQRMMEDPTYATLWSDAKEGEA